MQEYSFGKSLHYYISYCAQSLTIYLEEFLNLPAFGDTVDFNTALGGAMDIVTTDNPPPVNPVSDELFIPPPAIQAPQDFDGLENPGLSEQREPSPPAQAPTQGGIAPEGMDGNGTVNPSGIIVDERQRILESA